MSRQNIGRIRSGSGGQSLPFSPAVRAGDFVYVSGQTAMNDQGEIESGGIEFQSHKVFEIIKNILEIAGCKMEDVIKVNVWLDDTRDFAGFNSVFIKHFPKNPPARSTVQSKLVVDAKIEADVVAYKQLS
ncbi:RidA family protein [Deltaproteobacteria bacterium]|nr:RidA family protein [Deltaproteobacteria bacterium]|tara:strand:- start:291 stop:680 length:390 start_codon:yes stop_codon:yes gene_type:complete